MSILTPPNYKSSYYGVNNTDTKNPYYNNIVAGSKGDSYDMRPQAYKDTSSDNRRNLSSFFAFGKRSAEKDAFRQAHMTPSGTPGVLNLGVLDNAGSPIPFAPFEWNGRQMVTDAKGMIKYIEKDYFQTAISLENERVKYISQMISLVAGQPAESVIALFGYEFYTALAGDDIGPNGPQARYAQELYKSYLITAGIDSKVAERKIHVFARYSDAECSPEVMCNYGDNDPEWSRSFNKLSLLIEFHPSAILFDSGSLNPLESSGKIHGDNGMHNAGPPGKGEQATLDRQDREDISMRYPDSNRVYPPPPPPQTQAARSAP